MKTFIAVLAIGLTLAAQAVGPDVIVGDLTTPDNYGTVGGVSAFAVGTTSCNIGNTILQWQANNANHPVIGQTLYRMKDGKFEQIGTAWMKHGFYALQDSLCQTCTPHPNGSALGVGCSDPYVASLNGAQNGLGARSEINAANGVFPYPPVLNPAITNLASRRLQALNTDLDPAQNAGALYFAEAQYITADDAAAGNDNNNASWRQMNIIPFGAGWGITEVGATVREFGAVHAWSSFDPSVVIQTIDISGDGRLELGVKVTDLGGGMKQLEYALHNLNSNRSVGSFTLNFAGATSITTLGFHDAGYHSGEPYSGTDWTASSSASSASWTTLPFSSNANANALRWGHTFNFRCQAAQIPTSITLGLFKPGTPTSVTVTSPTMPTPSWQVNTAAASMSIDGATNNGFVGPISVTRIPGTTSILAVASPYVGSPWEIVVVPALALPNVAIGAQGQIVNVNLGNPGAITLNGGFASTWAAPLWQTALVAPPVGLTLSAQFAVITPVAGGMLALSAANEWLVVPCSGGNQPLTLGDDDSVLVPLGFPNHCGVSSINFYGTSYTSLHVNSNGSVSFNQGTGDFSPVAAAFNSQMPRLAGHWSDLEPNAAGTVTATSTSAGVFKVSFVNVPEWGSGNTKLCSFDMSFDTASGSCGVQAYSHSGGAWSTDTLVGISRGIAATSTSVAFSSFLGLGAQNGVATRSIYQLAIGAAPLGFNSITFPTSNGASFIVQ
ncbi:MAG: hypothetical protein EXS14_09770 [Planctomycetes bacterium]|nr:hypothetical protein [Planctomycetota bacterium]